MTLLRSGKNNILANDRSALERKIRARDSSGRSVLYGLNRIRSSVLWLIDTVEFSSGEFFQPNRNTLSRFRKISQVHLDYFEFAVRKTCFIPSTTIMWTRIQNIINKFLQKFQNVFFNLKPTEVEKPPHIKHMDDIYLEYIIFIDQAVFYRTLEITNETY